MMLLNEANVLRVLNKNFGHPITETIIGEAIKMDPFDAFVYANCTGAGYLENEVFPYTPKGCMKALLNAFDHNFVTGLFENNKLKNTPFYIAQEKPYIFQADKFVVPVSFESEAEYRQKIGHAYAEIKASGGDPRNFIIQRIEAAKNGSGMEPFLEYLVCEKLKRDGYVSENQIPLTHTVGSPDAGGFKGFGLQQAEGVGFHLIELSMLRMMGRDLTLAGMGEIECVVAEAKTSTSQMLKQLQKYWNTGLFDFAFEVHPSKKQSTSSSFGMINIGSDYMISVERQTENAEATKRLSRADYCQWLVNYLKIYLIANFSNEELSEIANRELGKVLKSPRDVVALIEKLTFEKIGELL